MQGGGGGGHRRAYAKSLERMSSSSSGALKCSTELRFLFSSKKFPFAESVNSN